MCIYDESLFSSSICGVGIITLNYDVSGDVLWRFDQSAHAYFLRRILAKQCCGPVAPSPSPQIVRDDRKLQAHPDWTSLGVYLIEELNV